MDSMDYEGNDPGQQVPQHLAGNGKDTASDSLSEAHSWEADERFDSTPEAEWGRRSRWSAANQEQGFNDPFHNPKWDWNSPKSGGSDVAQQSGSSWDEGEDSVVGSREPRTRSLSDWDWVSPAEARRRKQLQARAPLTSLALDSMYCLHQVLESAVAAKAIADILTATSLPSSRVCLRSMQMGPA